MTPNRPTHDPAPQPLRTRSRFEDGAVGLHADRLRHRPAGNGDGPPPDHPENGVLRNGRRADRPIPGLRTPLLAAAAVGAAGLAAAVWGLARSRRAAPAPLPAPSLPAPLGTWSWRGHRIATYRRGEGPPVVLVHSIHAAASGHEMRQLFERLARDRTVHAYDLLGFGASERPPLDYRAELYVDLLGDFLTEVVGEAADVVASSLSGGHALHAACRWPQRFRSLVLVNPTGLVTLANGRGRLRRLAEAAFRAPVVGEALFNALVARPSLAWYDRKAYRDPALVDDLLEQQWATAHQPNARFAPAAFLGNSLAINVARALRRLEVPALTVWTPPSGFQDTEAESRAFAHLNPHLDSRVIEDCGAVPHEERPADFEAVVRQWWEGARGGAEAESTQPDGVATRPATMPDSAR